MKTFIKQLLNAVGYDILRRSPVTNSAMRRLELIKQHNVTVVIDGGANVGQYASSLREGGYKGRIISVEPVGVAYEQLQLKADKDTAWECVAMALGNFEGKQEINVAAQTVNSSFLPQQHVFLTYSSKANYEYFEEVNVRRLDSVWHDWIQPGENVMLKLDVQGYEEQVLNGCGTHLYDLTLLEIELSPTPLYIDEKTFSYMLQMLEEHEFELIYLDNAVIDPRSYVTLQFNCIFRRLTK